MSEDDFWREKETEYLRLLKEADQRYWEVVRQHKESIRDLNLVWIGSLVILGLGIYFQRNLF
jgi:hypothetical protein